MIKEAVAINEAKGKDARQSWSREGMRRVLNVTERQLKVWERHDLVPPAESYFFQDLVALRKLVSLKEQRVPPAAIMRSVALMRAGVRELANPLSEVNFIREGKRLRVHWHGTTMEAVSGQLLFNFEAAPLKRMFAFPNRKQEADARQARTDESGRRAEAERLFQEGLQLEQSGAPIERVIETYNKAAQLDPTCAGAFVNLGTIHFHRHELADSEKQYRLALEANPDYALAHFNLGNLYDEQGNQAKALFHYRAALTLSPQYADAHYNLALLHQASGHLMDALSHWKSYLKLDPGSSWAIIARRELGKLRKLAVVEGTRGAAAGDSI